MKCDEVQPLHGPYLDSELDAKTTLEIQQHVVTCPDCARAFATEGRLEARIMAGLKQGQRTAALWEQVEHRVLAAAQSVARPQRPAREAHATTWWRELLWPCPQA
jgi:anti-sigma factor RsiW